MLEYGIKYTFPPSLIIKHFLNSNNPTKCTDMIFWHLTSLYTDTSCWNLNYFFVNKVILQSYRPVAKFYVWENGKQQNIWKQDYILKCFHFMLSIQPNDIYIWLWLWYRDNAVWSQAFPFPVSKMSHGGTVEGKVFSYKSKSRWQGGFGIVFPLSIQVRLLTALWAEKNCLLYLYLCDQYTFCTFVCTQFRIYIHAAKLERVHCCLHKKTSFVSYFITVFLRLSESKTNLYEWTCFNSFHIKKVLILSFS